MMAVPINRQTGRYALDLAERAVKTAGQAFGAQLLASGWLSIDQITDLSLVQRAGVAAVAAGLSVVTSALSRLVGGRDSASAVPGV